MSAGRPGDEGYFNARNCLLFSEHRRLYMSIGDCDIRRLAQVYDLPEAEVAEVVAGCESELSRAAGALAVAPADRARLVGLRAGPPLLFIGDSNSSYRRSYLNVVRKYLEPSGTAIVDTSIPGLNSQDVVDHFEDQVQARKPCVAAVMIGTNDVRRSSQPLGKNITGLPEFEANMDFILGRLARAGARVLALSIPPIDSDRMGAAFGACGWSATDADIADYNAALARAAAKSGARFVDLDGLLAERGMGEVLVDGLHLSPAAHEKIAALFLAKLAAALPLG